MFNVNVNCRYCISDHCGLCVDPTCLCRQSHNKTELLNAFTETARKFLPSSIEELKQILKEAHEQEDQELVSIDYQSKFEIYEQANNEQRFASDLVSDIGLPGHLYDGKKSCGKWKTKVCYDHEGGHGYIKKGDQHCHRKGCVTCWKNTNSRDSNSATNRTVALCSLKNNSHVNLNKNRKRVLIPVILSLPKDRYETHKSIKGRKKNNTFANRILNSLGIDGGAIIDHGYRFNEEKTKAVFSPHYHSIVTGWIDGKKVKEVYEKTGVIIKVGKPLGSAKNVRNYSRYVLSHASVYMTPIGKRSSEHSIRYFGECQNRKFKVDSVLKYSNTGYDQISEIMKTKQEKIKKIDGRRVALQLQKVSYTFSTIEDEIKNVIHKPFLEYCDGKTGQLTKALNEYVEPYCALLDTHKDNPAMCESEPFSFLQMRFDYGNSPYDIVVSEYHSIILDTNLDELCPECSQKLQVAVPIDREDSDSNLFKIAELVKSLPLDMTLPIDNLASMFIYRRDQPISYKGIEYFDFDGMLQYDDGIYQKPSCLSKLNPGLYYNIETEVSIQEFKHSVKTSRGKGLSIDERMTMNNDVKDFIAIRYSKKSAYHKPLECYNYNF